MRVDRELMGVMRAGRWARGEARMVRKENESGIILLICLGLAALVILIFATPSHAYTDEQLADAIKLAENSKTHPFGILAHYKHTTPRQACLNTIAHARRDWTGTGDFLEFLSKRYAPIGAKNDPRGLNRNWLKNVRFYLRKVVGNV